MTRAQQLRAEVSEIAHESFDGAMVVKTLGREPEETERFGAKARELRDVNIRVGRIRAAFDPTLAALPNLGVLVVLAVGVSRVHQRRRRPRRRRHRRLPAHHRQLPDPLDRLAARRVPAQRRRLPPGRRGAAHAPARCRTATPPAPAAARAERGSRSSRPRLRLRARPAAARATCRFTVEPGRTVALVGATASGKSTLTTLLTRLVDPDDGVVRVDGTDVRDLAHGELAPGRCRSCRRRAFLFDDTVRGNVTLGRRRRRRRGVGRAAHRPGRRVRRRPARRPVHAASASAARRCRAASASASRWPARSCAARGC